MEPGGQIILYQRDNSPAVDVRLDGETVWLSLNQLSLLLGRDKSTISRHISNIFAEGELDRSSVVVEFATTATDGKTAAEIISERADAGKPYMGLLSFSGIKPTKADTAIAKNYLNADELKRLSTLVSAYFDAAEFRAMSQKPTYMKDWIGHMEQLITAMGGESLKGAGSVSHKQAIDKAESEYAKYRSLLTDQPTEVEKAYLETIKSTQKKISKKDS